MDSHASSEDLRLQIAALKKQYDLRVRAERGAYAEAARQADLDRALDRLLPVIEAELLRGVPIKRRRPR